MSRLGPGGRRRMIAGAMMAVAGATSLTACGGSTTAKSTAAQPHTQVVRKSASAMTPAEVDRFERAFSYAVRKGYFDAFNEEHLDHTRNRNHGVDLTATSPISAVAAPSITWGYRLLPWHRSFILEAETMLRAALRERDRSEGRNPREADDLFIPYWDAAHEQALPAWVQAFQPQGGTALVPSEGMPKGSPGYGKPAGSRYDIQFGRWPGNNAVFDTLPAVPYVSEILASDDFAGLYRRIEFETPVNLSALPGAKAGLEFLARRFPDNANVQTLVDTLKHLPHAVHAAITHDIDAAAKVVNAFLGVSYLATSEEFKPNPDWEVIFAVKELYAVIVMPAHIDLHLWAGGLNPASPDVRGTVTYFNELAVDPVFWMLHTELDRWWYTWEQSHTGLPPLTGDDTKFQPLTTQEGAWYGGGHVHTLSDLADTHTLPYRYAALFTGSSPSLLGGNVTAVLVVGLLVAFRLAGRVRRLRRDRA